MDDLFAGQTRCLLVHPGFSSNGFFNYSEVARFVGAKYSATPLGMLTVAALFPQHWEFRLVDENVRPLADADLDWADLVLTGGMLTQQKSVLSTIQRSHDRGLPVVVGGPDPSSQPGVYRQADYLVLGEGEVTIPLLIEDLAKGVRSGIYCSEQRADMAEAVVPRFDLVRFADYMRVGIQFSRGCPYNCEFCDIIERFGRTPRTKTAAHMVAELQALYDLGSRGHVDFVDDNLIGDRPKATEMLQAVADWSRRHRYPFYYSTEASINLARDTELLALMQESDFRYVFVGIESAEDEVLAEAHKIQNRRVDAVDAVRTLASHGIIVNGGFVLGFDSETERTAGHMIDLIQETGICSALVSTLTALPNTQLSRRLAREGRLFAGGLMVAADHATDVDQTTGGLNYATARPRTAILRDQVQVYRQIYDPGQYYRRIRKTAAQLVSHRRYRPSPEQSLKLARSFFRVSARAGLNLRTGPLYWKTLLQVLVTNPAALEAVVSMAALYIHYARQSAFVIDTLETRIAEIERRGEDSYNRSMIAGLRSEGPTPQPA
ncbi:MAG: B12-binding domain-containing radical SAM protein [Anaerolineae bacterium]